MKLKKLCFVIFQALLERCSANCVHTLSGRNKTPNSTKGYARLMIPKRLGFTESSTPQNPSARSLNALDFLEVTDGDSSAMFLQVAVLSPLTQCWDATQTRMNRPTQPVGYEHKTAHTPWPIPLLTKSRGSRLHSHRHDPIILSRSCPCDYRTSTAACLIVIAESSCLFYLPSLPFPPSLDSLFHSCVPAITRQQHEFDRRPKDNIRGECN